MGNEKTPLLTAVFSDAAQNAARKILALRKLTRETGTRTTRTQNSILQTLSPEVLAEVAVILAGLGQGGAQ